MAELNGGSFVNGLMQGVNFVQGVKAHNQSMDLAQQQNDRAAETHDLQMQEGGIRLENMKQAEQERMAKAMAWSAYNVRQAPKEYQDILRRHPNLDADRLTSDEGRSATATLQAAIDGKIDYRSPQVAKAFDFLNPEIQLGAKDGRKVSTSRLYAGTKPDTVMVGLKVEGDDKEKPLTVNRSSDPNDPVREITLDTLLGRLHVAQQVQAMLDDPKGRDAWIRATIGKDIDAIARSRTATEGKLSDGTPYLMDGKGEIHFKPRDGREPVTLGAMQTDNNGDKYQIDQNGGYHYQNGRGLGGGRGGGGGSGDTQRTKDFNFAKSLGMSEEEALSYANTNKGKNPQDAADEHARKMVELEKESMPEGQTVQSRYDYYYNRFLDARKSQQPVSKDGLRKDGAGQKDDKAPTPVPASKGGLILKPQSSAGEGINLKSVEGVRYTKDGK